MVGKFLWWEWNYEKSEFTFVLSLLCNKSAPHRNRECDKMFLVGQSLRFAEWLQAEMDKRGWSQSDCARAADLNRAVINKLLSGKSRPQPLTLLALAGGFKIPVEAVYRAAGLLPESTDGDEMTEELLHTFHSIQSPQRKATVLMLLKALVAEEENEQRGDSPKGKR